MQTCICTRFFTHACTCTVNSKFIASLPCFFRVVISYCNHMQFRISISSKFRTVKEQSRWNVETKHFTPHVHLKQCNVQSLHFKIWMTTSWNLSCWMCDQPQKVSTILVFSQVRTRLLTESSRGGGYPATFLSYSPHTPTLVWSQTTSYVGSRPQSCE